MSISTVIIIVVIAVAILVMLNLISQPLAKSLDKEHFKNEWQDVLKLAKEAKTRPMSVVHGDKLLDEALKNLGFGGETMAERLVSAKNNLKQREQVWFAHKLRNKIVHQTAFEPSESQVKKALKAYDKAFKDLGVW